MSEFKMNIDEIKVAMYALNGASLNNFRGEFVVQLANLMHRFHAAVVEVSQQASLQDGVVPDDSMPNIPRHG